MPKKMASFSLLCAGTCGAATTFASFGRMGRPAVRQLHSTPALRASPVADAGVTTGSWSSFRMLSCGAAAALLTGSLAGRRTSQRGLKQRAGVVAQAASRPLTNPQDLLSGVDIFIFDCDGVIWLGDSIIPGIPNVLDELRRQGKRMFFVTNNSTKSRVGYQGKFTGLGLSVQPEEIFSSSFAAAAYLEQTNFKATGKTVYVIGEKGITEELDLIGVPWIGAEAHADSHAPLQKGGRVDHDHNVGAVIVGFDRHINYYKLQYAQLCLNENPGCQFIATNLDRVTHLTDVQEWAGNGTMVGAIQGCTGMDPNVVGKPAPLMVDYIAEKYGVRDRSRICVVGDRLDTDIAFGKNNGLQTCLTLSGVTSKEELLHQKPRKKGCEDIEPEWYVNTINDFVTGSAPAAPAAAPAAGGASRFAPMS